MIRAGFRLLGGTGWQGGRNYLSNLFAALAAQPTRQVQPVLLVGAGEDPLDLALDGVEMVTPDPRLDSRFARRLGRVMKLAVRRNVIESHLLARANVDVLSHTGPVGGRIPTIAWIPDLQHRHLPHLSSRYERFMRDLLYREMLRDAVITIASSEAARADLVRFYAADPARIRVLRFVSQPRERGAPIALDDLRARYPIPARYFHLPNQLWKHKNHDLVVDALRHAPGVSVVATGPREDYRHAHMYEALQARIAKAGVGERFHHLGLVPFADLVGLMRHSVAVINPSRFEGWSTTVEEAKSLGKRVLVSELAVHREQAAPRASYFATDDVDALAMQMIDAWAHHDPAEDARAAAAAAEALPGRTRAFAETYEAIVLEAVGRR